VAVAVLVVVAVVLLLQVAQPTAAVLETLEAQVFMLVVVTLITEAAEVVAQAVQVATRPQVHRAQVARAPLIQ
jgi:hypothetical protein